MQEFFRYQRYTSKGEPELGVGEITEASNGKVRVYFPVADETRLYASESAPLLRVVFKVGDTVVDMNGQAIQVEKVELHGDFYMYFGSGRKLSEADLGDVSATHGVDDRLFMGDVDTPQKFEIRRETLHHDYQRKRSPVSGFVGGRIDLIPHQLYIAHEVSGRYAPRVLLSDQVGLGKTIEACLILHRLLLSGRISRAIIVVPESLVHQWFVEVLRKFNMWFSIFDEERCAALDESAPEGNPFLDDQLVICSINFLSGSAKRTQQALTGSWDMLVVDEAHNLEWSTDKVSREYAVIELLSKAVKGLLLLTATPEQLGVESHFARLRLLDPNRYASYEDFVNESSGSKDIANIVEKLHLKKKLDAEEIETLKTIFPEERVLAAIGKGNLAKDNLIEDLLDQHGPGRVLFRNTRSAMKGFPKRKAHLVPLEAVTDQAEWNKRLANEFVAEMTPKGIQNMPKFWFSKDPRVSWLLAKLKEIQPAKVLLICKSKEKVLALESVLTKRGNLKVGVFHDALTIVQRDRNAAWFSESNGAQILVCSEIGSEGRNFQFAHHLVLFDLPLHPQLLEQRIGRLDRIGQVEDIQIHIPYVVGSSQEVLVKWFHAGLNAFEENLEGGNEISKLFSARLLEIAVKYKAENDKTKLVELIKETSKFRKELKKKLADGRDRLLEMNSFRPKIADHLVKQIQAEDQDKNLEKYLTKVFGLFDVEMEDIAARTYFLHPAATSTEVFPSIPSEGIGVTFDRTKALRREDLGFLTWDHPLTTNAIDRVLSSGAGSASYGVLRGSGGAGLLLEILFLLETSGDDHIHVDRFLPNTPLRVVVDHTGKEVTDVYTVETFAQKLIPGQIDPLLDNEALVETILPSMIAAATKIAAELGEIEIRNGLKRMNLSLNHEVQRLKSLLAKNQNIRPQEIHIAVEEQSKLATAIQSARVRMDAIQLIRKE